MILARPIMALLGDYSGENLNLAAKLMGILGVSVFLYAIIQYTNAVLQSHNRAQIPVINMLVCGVAKLIVVYVLVGNPAIGILGAPLGMALCYLCIGVLNLIAIYKVVDQKPALVKNLLRPLLPALIMGVVVFVTYRALTALLGADGSRIVLCALPVMVGGVSYLVAVAACKAIKKEDCLLLPKGEKIAALLKLS